MTNDLIRNIAIIAHVDHGKTTLVDAMLRQSGIFRANEELVERVMDSNDLERERGITILAKTTGIRYHGVKINIVDTPGHSDFGGEVERALKMVDGVMLLVDASEGPLPQTRYVLMKALEAKLPPIVVINKIDRPDARIQEVLNEVYDLFIDLDATEDQLDFPDDLHQCQSRHREDVDWRTRPTTLRPLFEAIVKHIPAPPGDPDGMLQMLVANLDYSDYLGRLAIGRVFNGTLRLGDEVGIAKLDGIAPEDEHHEAVFVRRPEARGRNDRHGRATFWRSPASKASPSARRSPTPRRPSRCRSIQIDEPTIAMMFTINTSPFAGREGQVRHVAQSARPSGQGAADQRFDSSGGGRRSGSLSR